MKCEAQKAELTLPKTFLPSISNSSHSIFLILVIPILSKIIREKSFIEMARAPWDQCWKTDFAVAQMTQNIS